MIRDWSPARSWRNSAMVLFAIGIAVVIWTRNAAILDDAMITMRTVDHFVNGRGLVWNLGERVQVYTHPLWMFLLALFYLPTRDPFFMPLAVSAACVAAALATATWGREWKKGLVLLVAVLFSSKAFVDYSSSGLENPLSFLIIAALWAALGQSRPRLIMVAFLCSLSFLNRMDLVALTGPALAWVVWRAPKSRATLLELVLGLAPAALWLFFAVAYYGTPFPNTYYAKSGASGVSLWELCRAGAGYFLNLALWDPPTLLLLALSLLSWKGDRTGPRAAFRVGILGYALYIFSTGAAGTHMSGRFFAVVAFASALVVVDRLRESTWWPNSTRLATAWFLIAALFPHSPLKANTPLYAVPGGAYVDRFDFADVHAQAILEGSGLLTQHNGHREHGWYLEGRQFAQSAQRVKIGGASHGAPIGFFGMGARHDQLIIDFVGLSDPLLARLPIRTGGWRPGHFWRAVPDGYLESVERDRNELRDDLLRPLYDDVRLATRSPVGMWERAGAIWRLNTGYHHRALAAYRAKLNPLP